MEPGMNKTTRNIPPADKLPIDLIQLIISCLDDGYDDRRFCYREDISPDLHACSLVCRSWNEISRRHIFHTISVGNGQESLTSRLSFLYLAAPHLCKYTLSLDFCFDIDYDSAPEWISECLALFTNLRVLRLDARFVSGPVLDVLAAFGIMTHLTQVRLQELVLASWDLDEQAVDLLPILSACSASLESLMLDIYGVYERESSDPAGGISRDILPARLDALRNLRIVNSIRGLPRTVRIECPSLKEMEIRQSRVDPWTIPQWIRTNLHELVLDVCPIAPMPNVGGSIRPSSLTINVVQTSMTRPLDIIEWIGKCIDCLQFADHLLELSINIDLQGWGGQDYPNAAHYEALYRIIEPLHKHGALRKVAINVGDVGDPLDLGEADFEEAAVFERVFAPLLEDIIAIGGVRRITCKYGWMNVLMSYEVTL